MSKIINFILALCIVCSLSSCDKQNSSENAFDSLVASQSVTASEKYSEYQSYTVDKDGNILDSISGEIIKNDKLIVDSSGNIALKVSNQVVVSFVQVQENKSTLHLAQTEDEKIETSPVDPKNNNSSIDTTSISTSPTTAVHSEDKSNNTPISNKVTETKVHVEPTPIPESINWDSLYSEKEWVFFITDPSRLDCEGSNASVCRFSAKPDLKTTIYVESYCLLDNWKYPINDSITVKTFNGQKYVQVMQGNYSGALSTVIGGEDIVTLELKCSNFNGHTWLSDELKFKRINNNTLQLISGDYKEFGLKNGDVFVR